jgi:hypothetical protein
MLRCLQLLAPDVIYQLTVMFVASEDFCLDAFKSV